MEKDNMTPWLIAGFLVVAAGGGAIFYMNSQATAAAERQAALQRESDLRSTLARLEERTSREPAPTQQQQAPSSGSADDFIGTLLGKGVSWLTHAIGI